MILLACVTGGAVLLWTIAAFAIGRSVGFTAGVKYADGYLRRRFINGDIHA